MTEPPRRTEDLELALHAARRAGEAIMEAFGSDQEVRHKSADQPVTDADLRADRTLREMLGRARPEYGWLSEETADSDARLEKERLWVVDPIDGTSSFVKGRREFVVSVGLVENGEPVLGVLHNPASGETFHAVVGGGAFLNGVRIRVSGTGAEAPERTAVGSRSDLLRGELEVLVQGGWRVVGLGSTAYKIGRVADGTVDGYLSFGPKAEWDLCAAAVVLAEAGGRVTYLDGMPLRFNRRDPSWHGMIASNGRVHEALIAAARSARGRPGERAP